MLSFLACFIGATAAWLSLAALAVVPAGPEGPASRVGLIPPLWVLALFLVAFFSVRHWLSRRGDASSALPLLAAGFLLLPWLPLKIPAVFFALVRPLTWLLWSLVVLSMIPVALSAFAARDARSASRSTHGFFYRLLRNPRLAPILAGAIALVIYAGGAFRFLPYLPGGDEPHYLIIAQSLWRDGDLRIENNHRQQDYREYFNRPLAPHYLQPGLNGHIYSVHAPGLPALIAPVLALAGYWGVVAGLIGFASIGSGWTWHLAHLLTKDAGAAWFGWAAVSLSVPFFFQAFGVYPDGLAGTLIVFAATWLVRVPRDQSISRWMMRGALIGLLPWLHTRYAVLAGLLGLFVGLHLWQTRQPRRVILGFFLPLVVASMAWFGFFWILYGTPSPAAPYGTYTQTDWRHVPTGLTGMLLDQRFGMMMQAPVLLVTFLGFYHLARERFRLALELLLVFALYLGVSSGFHMWWGGSSAPVRWLVPVVLLLALPASMLFSRARHQATRALAVISAGVSCWIVFYLWFEANPNLVYGGRADRPFFADWIFPLMSVAEAFPDLFDDGPALALAVSSVWIANFIIAWVVVVIATTSRRASGRAEALRHMPPGDQRWSRPLGLPAEVQANTGRPIWGAVSTAVLLASGVATIVSIDLIWRMRGISGTIPNDAGQLAMLRRYDPGRLPSGIVFNPLTLTTAEEAVRRLRVRYPVRPVQESRPVSWVPLPPPGDYRLRFELKESGAADQTSGGGETRAAVRKPAAGRISIFIGRHDQPIETFDFNDQGLRVFERPLHIPVPVHSVRIEADVVTQRRLENVTWIPDWVQARSLRPDVLARRAAVYGASKVYFADERAYPEAGGFWVAGGRETRIAIEPAGPRPTTIRLFVRNAPVDNELLLKSDAWQSKLALRAREEREAVIPLQTSGQFPGASDIGLATSGGFQPALVEPGSQDRRYLGCWIEVR